MISTSAAFAHAVKHHEAGRLGDAESLYREILSRDLLNATVLHALGLLHSQRGEYLLALECFDKAVASRKDVARYHNDHAEALMALERRDEAILYRTAIRVDRSWSSALSSLQFLIDDWNTSGRRK